MSASWILHRIYSLDTPPLDLLRPYIYCLIRHDEEDQYLSSLQGPRLARLVDFLNKVCTLHAAFFPVTKRAPQIISAIPADDDLFRQCLHKLQAICGHRATLPSSYIISGEFARVGDGPIASGDTADIWEGTYCGEKVAIRSLKVTLSDDRTLDKVRTWYGMLYRVWSRTPICKLQSFFREAVMWGRLRHPNIVPFIGITTDPLQIVSEWMPNGTLTEFVEKNPDVNRIGLVSLPPVTALD